MSSLACTLHLRPPGQVRQCTGSSRKLPGRLTGRALGRGACLIQVQLERGGSWVLAQTEPWERRRGLMTAAPPAEPSPCALGESLAALTVQVADLRGQVRAINERLDQAGLRAGVNLAARFEELAQTVADALDAAAPRGPAAPYWIGLDRDTYATRLAELRRWADTVLRQNYGGYKLPDCWPRHIHAIWELSTLAAEWH